MVPRLCCLVVVSSANHLTKQAKVIPNKLEADCCLIFWFSIAPKLQLQNQDSVTHDGLWIKADNVNYDNVHHHCNVVL